MRTIGLLGGMSWESTASYYRVINEHIRLRLGEQHSAKILLCSVDFGPIEKLQVAGNWELAGRMLAEDAARVEAGGADFLLLCSNTMHKVASQVQEAIGIPLIHIADVTADCVQAAGKRRVGLLGTRFTMEEDFYRDRLERRHGLEVLVPEAADRRLVDEVIFTELCQGKVREPSRAEYVRVIGELARRGAEGVILGCTEIGLLVGDDDSPVQVFDTTRIHSQRAVELALGRSARAEG